MESIPVHVDTERQEYDYELLPEQKLFGDFTNKLLELKAEDDPWTFIDIKCIEDVAAMREILRDSLLSRVAHNDDEQLAMDSQGYYPELDISKQQASLKDMVVRVWGWESDKIRYTDLDQEEATYPRQFVEYEGQKDWMRQLDINFLYERNDGGYFNEIFTLYGVSLRQETPSLHSKVWASDYADTGYEGHGRKSLDDDLSAEDVHKFIEIVSKAIGWKP